MAESESRPSSYDDHETGQDPQSDGPTNAPASASASPIRLRGGPSKIRGLQQSAAAAQTEREKFEQNEGDAKSNGGGSSSGGGGATRVSAIMASARNGQAERERLVKEGGSSDEEDKDDIPPVQGRGFHMKGGPDKMSAVKNSAADAQERREAFEREQGAEAYRRRHDDTDAGAGVGPDAGDQQQQPPGRPVRRLSGIMQSARDGRAERTRQAQEHGGDED